MHRIRNYIIEIGLIGALLVAVAFFGYLGYGLLRPEIVDERFDGARAGLCWRHYGIWAAQQRHRGQPQSR